MSESSDTPTKPRIKVTDRRMFDSEGNLRSNVDSDLKSASPSTEPAAEAPASGSVAETAPASGPVAETAPPASGPVAETVAPKSRWFGRAPKPDPTREPDPPPAAAQPPEPAAPGAAAPGAPPATRDLPRDLSGLVESQYFEALLYMGAMPHPATGKVIEDLDMAQYKIDLLGMLKTKTEGNRTSEESKVLEDVLYQLRMMYLQKSKVAKL